MLIRPISDFLQTHQLMREKLLVGVSGGADSLALLHGLWKVGVAQLSVVHVDHGLRENSAEDAHHVEQLCAAWNIPCTIKRLALASESEETARRERYRTLSSVAQSEGATAILTAHHADDQVETVLMNIMRGAGVEGLSGMSAVSSVPYGVDEAQRLYRPLLTLTRSEILSYCQQNDIPFVEDATNQDKRYFRNRVRHELLPTLERSAPQIRKRLLQLAEISSADSDLLHTLTQETYANLITQRGEQWHELDLSKWRSLPLGLRRRTLRHALSILDTELTDVGFGVIEEARHVAEHGHVGKQATLPNGWRVTVGYERLLIGAQSAMPPLDVPQVMGVAVLPVPGLVKLENGWEISAEVVTKQDTPQSSHIVYIPYFEKLTVRGRQAGERMRPQGATGSAKLKRIMIDRKIPQRVRAHWPLVMVNGQIIWFVGEVLGETGGWKENTVHIKLELRRSSSRK